MFEECPACLRLTAQIQAADELELIEIARQSNLRALCLACGNQFLLPADLQAELAGIEHGDGESSRLLLESTALPSWPPIV